MSVVDLPSDDELDQIPDDLSSLRPPFDRRRQVLTALVVVSVVAIVWAWFKVDLSIAGITQSWGDVVNLLERMFPPRYTNLGRWIDAAIETFFMALLGTTIAVVLSFPLAFLAARNTTINGFTRGLARAVITASRAIPDLVFALIFVAAVGIGPLAGILALALHSIGMIGKLFADAIEEIDEGPRDAVLSTGSTQMQALSTSVLPQVMPSFISTSLYRMDINVRTSVILGIVGAGGIGFELQAALRALAYPRGLGIVTVIIAMVVIVEWLSAMMRRSLLGADSAALGFSGKRRGRALATFRRHRTAHPDRMLVDPPVFGPAEARDDAAEDALAAIDDTPPEFDHRSLTPPWDRERIKKAAFALLVGFGIGYSFVAVDLDPIELLAAIPEIWSEAMRLVPPDFTTARDSLIQGLSETIAIGILATFFGTLMSIPLGLLAARNVSPARWTYLGARYLLVFIRAIPELILAVIFVAAIGLGPIGGVMALSIGAVGFLAKLLADAVEQVADGPREAVVTTGATRMQEVATSVIPQAMPAFVSSALYMLDINIRASVVVGIVGGGGIGFLLSNSMRVREFQTTGAIILSIFVIVFVIEQVSGWVRKQII
jgi:phosphonate transport system permease protein